VLGTLCVADRASRALGSRENATLGTLAGQLASRLDLCLRAHELERLGTAAKLTDRVVICFSGVDGVIPLAVEGVRVHVHLRQLLV